VLKTWPATVSGVYLAWKWKSCIQFNLACWEFSLEWIALQWGAY
jgi:hypothetical protein